MNPEFEVISKVDSVDGAELNFDRYGVSIVYISNTAAMDTLSKRNANWNSEDYNFNTSEIFIVWDFCKDPNSKEQKILVELENGELISAKFANDVDASTHISQQQWVSIIKTASKTIVADKQNKLVKRKRFPKPDNKSHDDSKRWPNLKTMRHNMPTPKRRSNQ